MIVRFHFNLYKQDEVRLITYEINTDNIYSDRCILDLETIANKYAVKGRIL